MNYIARVSDMDELPEEVARVIRQEVAKIRASDLSGKGKVESLMSFIGWMDMGISLKAAVELLKEE